MPEDSGGAAAGEPAPAAASAEPAPAPAPPVHYTHSGSAGGAYTLAEQLAASEREEADPSKPYVFGAARTAEFQRLKPKTHWRPFEC